MLPTIFRKRLVSPDGMQKVELYGPRDGAFGFRCGHRKGKAWKQESDRCEFESYARTVVEASKRIDWLARALGDYHLELLRGLAFRYSVYREETFGDHDHCCACWAKLAERDWLGVLHEGYVTRYFIPGGSGRWQWNWVCTECFAKLREPMQWGLESS